MAKKKSKLKVAQEEAQAAVNKTNEKIEELGGITATLYSELSNIQEAFDEIRNVPSEKKLQYEELKERNTALQATIDSQAAKVDALEKQLAQLRADYDSLKLARMVTITDGDMETAQKRIARLIRQVDKCITLLGESDK